MKYRHALPASHSAGPHVGGVDPRYANALINSPSAAGQPVTLEPVGDDANIDVVIAGKGTGQPKFPSGLQGGVVTKIVSFTENATATSHVGTVAIPAGAVIHDIRVIPQALWTGGAAVMKVGDTADDDGYFVGVDLKATDLLVGEVLSSHSSTLWGGKEGAYLVAASGRRGPVANNFGEYYAAGSNIVATITVTTPATTVGRTFLVVSYSVGTLSAAVAS